LQQVAEVLARDDLAELNPIKFYVVRPIAPRDPFGGGESPHAADEIISGRIQVRPNEPSMRMPWDLEPLKKPPQAGPRGAMSPQEMMRMLRGSSSTQTRTPATSTADVAAPADERTRPTAEPIAAPNAGAPSQTRVPTDSAPKRELSQPQAASEVSPSAPATIQPAPTDRTVVAYNIPDELRDDVRQYQNATDLDGIWDERGRFVMWESDATDRRNRGAENRQH
jgi:hypothetical protein